LRVALCNHIGPGPSLKCTSAIASNFNGTAIAAGDYVWFNGVLKVNGLGSAPATIFVTHASITFTANGKAYLLTVPDSQITLSSSITVATTAFTKLSAEIGSPFGWLTKLPASGLAGNDLGVKPVDDNKASHYQNSDHAGTPEYFRVYVIGGARGVEAQTLRDRTAAPVAAHVYGRRPLRSQ
jgi:hypothetical protein